MNKEIFYSQNGYDFSADGFMNAMINYPVDFEKSQKKEEIKKMEQNSKKIIGAFVFQPAGPINWVN